MHGSRRKRKKDVAIPEQFTVRFWEDADQRSAVAKEIRRRYERLKRDCGCESYQQDLLVQNAVFIAVQLETQRFHAVENGTFDPGVHAQMVNCLSGLLTKLGLKKQSKSKTVDLDSYVRVTSLDFLYHRL